MQSLTARFPLPAAEFKFAGFSWPRYVAVLPSGSKAARIRRHKNPVTGPYYHAPQPVTGPHPGRGFYFESDGMPGLRGMWCDDVADNIRHTGWFTDDFQSQTLRGFVFRLPRGRGFLAGYTFGADMYAEIDGRIYTDETGAAYAADRMAETAADAIREENEGEEWAL